MLLDNMVGLYEDDVVWFLVIGLVLIIFSVICCGSVIDIGLVLCMDSLMVMFG